MPSAFSCNTENKVTSNKLTTAQTKKITLDENQLQKLFSFTSPTFKTSLHAETISDKKRDGKGGTFGPESLI